MTRRTMIHNYLETLGLQDRQWDFSLLTDLIAKHVATYSFSSVNCQLGDDLPLDFASLYQRIVVEKRGGYCFEQNGLLFEILEELGFSPQLYLARVIHNQDIHPGLTHRINMVEHNGTSYVVDAGFGSDGPRIPVAFSEKESIDGHRIYRVFEKEPGQFHMQIFKDGCFFSLYRFERSRYAQADCELGHFYSHRHTAANFVNHLVVSRLTQTEIHSIVDLEYWLIKKSNTKKQNITSPGQLKQLLSGKLNLLVSEQECQILFEKHASKAGRQGYSS